ncbi:HAD family hydrolase [Pedobacter insulae]|uniref:Haloacid dehalogenase superfamily, subfamily IA, variant 3 with third motif having DD or ED n=1 Tax=Pedobacter insulae TaxID=414048 RepID=A0A1I2YE65_9SPHI|nr:HAD family phosphatase [Pedobacter insulae]SFH23953.1 haloacid dehalogenase superfamily, subfamily IA, variant 3 with third motif having DD or ED [Pedobacter insulae]
MQEIIFKPKAFLFDLNGTMINDMSYHADAWYAIITKRLGLAISYEAVKNEMYGKNEELLIRIFGVDYFTSAEVEAISMAKEKSYQEAYAADLKLIDGLDDFLATAKTTGIKMAIGSAAIPFNIDFVLDGLNARQYFDGIVSANDVKLSKPDPETFLNAAAVLGIEPQHCLVFEDVPKGVESADRAGMKCFVVTTTHRKEEFKSFPNILGFIKDYNDPILTNLF